MNVAEIAFERPVDDFHFPLDLGLDLGGFTLNELLATQTKAQFALLMANRAMVGMTLLEARCAAARKIADTAQMHLSVGKWYAGLISGAYNGVGRSSDPVSDGNKAMAAINRSMEISRALEAALATGADLSTVEALSPELDSRGTEILYADGVPIVPSICPIVLLKGSDREMGFQYAQQIIEIYGTFNFAHFATFRIEGERLAVLREWERQLQEHTPQILEFCRGWALGATEAGLAMSYDQVLMLWVGTNPPAPDRDTQLGPMFPDPQLPLAMYFAQSLALNETPLGARPPVDGNPAEMCSGICAWGESTPHGRLVTASTTDHECWMQATIVAYPDNGIPYIYTPFAVAGWLPGMGSQRFAGHPGMNAEGLAYVHHGGETHMIEPIELWGYGVPRGAATFDTLQNCSTAKEARDRQLSLPIGDVGVVLGAPGGQWADSEYGFVLESRERTATHPHGLIREYTVDHEGASHQILYAGNSSMHPDASGHNHGYEAGELDYDIERGWHSRKAGIENAATLKRTGLRMTAKGGGRPQRFFKHAIPSSGDIDADWMARLYRSPTLGYPEYATWEADYSAVKSGEKSVTTSMAKRLNAFTAIMEPASDGQGLYHACIGPLSRDLPPGGVDAHEYFYVDETNVMWTLRLAECVDELVVDAGQRAADDIEAAKTLIAEADPNVVTGIEALADLLEVAGQALLDGHQKLSNAQSMSGLARVVRLFTIAQVRARQIIDAFQPPVGLPDPN